MIDHSRKRPRIAGFTMIEVMITVAIVAILAAIVLPTYTEYVTRSKLVEAKAGLADMRTRLEQYFLDNRKFPTECVAPASGAAGAGKIYLPASTKNFGFTCALADSTYTVTATGVGSMASFQFTIDQANTRATTNLPSGWSGKGSACWVSRKNGDCG
jgi:type IV pilus assembly protein PilE